MSDYKVDPNNPLPRYYQVYVSMEKRIRAGEFVPGEAIPSERQLAIDYGVSRITVVKAVDMLVDDNLIERQHGRGNFVLDCSGAVICGEGYRVAFCVPTPSESYIFSALLGATKVAMHNHIHLQTVEIGDGEEEVEQIKALIERDFAGLILFSRSAHRNAAFYQELQEKQYPFLMIDRYCPDVRTDTIVFDDETAAYCLTETLIQAGHRRIAILLSTETFATSVRDRLNGYRKALQTHNVPYNEHWVGQDIYEVFELSPDYIDQLRTKYVEFLEHMHHHAPTAVLTINNYSAEQANVDLAKIQMELMQAIIADGAFDIAYELKIPLASISHKPLSLNLTPVVALALQSGEILGEQAMDLLIARITQSMRDSPRMIKIPMAIHTYV